MAKGKRVAKPKITKEQFALITDTVYASLFLRGSASMLASMRMATEVDCVALLAYMNAAVAVYQVNCPIAQPTLKQAKKVAVKAPITRPAQAESIVRKVAVRKK